MPGELSSQLLAYKQYVRKYLEFMEKTDGAASNQAWLKMVEMIDNDFPNERVHPMSVILAACQLAYLYGRATHRSSVGAVDYIVNNWDGATGRIKVNILRMPRGLLLPGRDF